MNPFKGGHFPKEVILMSIRWYLSYPLSYRYIEALLEERGVTIDHATINRWVVKFSSILERKFRKYKKKCSKAGAWMKPTLRLKGNGTIIIVQ